MHLLARMSEMFRSRHLSSNCNHDREVEDFQPGLLHLLSAAQCDRIEDQSLYHITHIYLHPAQIQSFESKMECGLDYALAHTPTLELGR